MCERDSQFTSLPDPAGPADDQFVYQLTAEGKRALEEHERATGTPVHTRAAPVAAVAAERKHEERRQLRRELARKAGESGHRVGTVCGRWREGGKVPDLRISGAWLRKAGFDVGQVYEVAVTNGHLTILQLV
jgi:Toxin SymE, type I toxin-antitoxin system